MEKEDITYEELMEEFKADFWKFVENLKDLASNMKKQQKQDKLFVVKMVAALLFCIIMLINLNLIVDGLMMIVGVLGFIALVILPIYLAIKLSKYAARKKKEQTADREKELAEYLACSYYAQTQKPLETVEADIDRYAEYLIYKELQHFEEQGAKFLFKLSIPHDSGRCSEIDILMIHPKAVFVIQSQNIIGNIFGRENEPIWLNNHWHKGKKISENIQNPVIQTKACVNHMMELLGTGVPVHSLIVFPNKSNLNDVSVFYGNYVINLNVLNSIVTSIANRSKTMIPSDQIEALQGKLSRI